jgi:hypothetical protein
MRKLSLAAALLAIAPAFAAEPEPQTVPPAAAPVEATQPAPQGSVARSTFTNGIEDREPVDSVAELNNSSTRVYFFSELRGLAGQTVMHRWEHDGKVMAEVPFTVGGDRWRVYSSKTLDPSWTGDWKVTVVDGTGGTLAVNTFSYREAPAAQPEQPAAETPKQ